MNYDYLNIGGGEDISIKELAYKIKKIIQFLKLKKEIFHIH